MRALAENSLSSHAGRVCVTLIPALDSYLGYALCFAPPPRAYRTNKPVNVFYDAKAAKKTAAREAKRAARRRRGKGRRSGSRGRSKDKAGGDMSDGGATSGSEGTCGVTDVHVSEETGSAVDLHTLPCFMRVYHARAPLLVL